MNPYHAILELSPDLVRHLDADKNVLYMNPAYKKMLGITDINNVTVELCHPASTLARFESEIFPQVKKTGMWQGYFEILNAEGEPVPVSAVVIAHLDEAGEITNMTSISRVLSEYGPIPDAFAE